MLVSLETFHRYADVVAHSGSVTATALDFETTGLNPRRGDRAFLLGVCIDGDVFSYKFQGHAAEADAMRLLQANPRVRYLAHNAKFEMGFDKEQWGVEIAGHVWDTEVMARLQYNNHMRYGLQPCAERIGESKYPPMLAWLKANGPKYHEAPDELVVPYVEQDARLSWLLYKDQCNTFREWETNSPVKIGGLVALEMRTTKNLFAMECVGLHLDVAYCKEALAYEQERAANARTEFQLLTGTPFTDSAKCLSPIFKSMNLGFGKTEKGNDSFNVESLSPLAAHPVVKAILAYRDANKRASTYWENFIQMHTGGMIHPNTRQPGAATGRFSITEPACQTWPDDSEDPTCLYPIRRAFVAPPDCDMVSMDYLGMELRFGVDQVEDMDMIRDILTGADLHQRVATNAGVSRTLGKRGRFLRQYGGGVPKMAKSLGITEDVARRIARALDDESPKLKAYSNNLVRYARYAPFGYNWMGRRFFFDKGFEYKYPNYWNQGGCSDILRVAIDDITQFLAKEARPQTRFVLPVHDELVFQWHKDDRHLVAPVRQLMADAYRIKKHLAMDVSVSRGPNMHDMENVK